MDKYQQKMQKIYTPGNTGKFEKNSRNGTGKL